MIFVGNDWAEDHHDIEVMDDAGVTLARRRLPEGVVGVGMLHALIAEHAEDPAQVVVGIETDRGLWVASLVAAGYVVFAVNPLAVSRYRDRHATSGAKSDTGDVRLTVPDTSLTPTITRSASFTATPSFTTISPAESLISAAITRNSRGPLEEMSAIRGTAVSESPTCTGRCHS